MQKRLKSAPGDGPETPKVSLEFATATNVFQVMALLSLANRNTAEIALALPTVEDKDAMLTDIITRSEQIAELTVIFDRLVRQRDADLNKRVYTDALTGVGNRHYFDDAFDFAIAQAKLTRKPLALLAFDIDHFKNVNDTFGHPVGDAVLRIFAQQLQKGVKEDDLVARYGGEEFMVALPDTTPIQARQVADRLRKAVAARKADAGVPAVTVSIGVAMLDKNDDSHTIKTRADQALYNAKKTGRNRVVMARATMQPIDGASNSNIPKMSQ